ncbi:helix-turn-helix domain-containing protein [Agaribacterium sp. ZY112]|uniref:helix-turn-helix domain-containing protein n=1 Tax=Agaribacterium sp. ZY112 TaxID=3233574 RepID=UPI0035266CDC
MTDQQGLYLMVNAERSIHIVSNSNKYTSELECLLRSENYNVVSHQSAFINFNKQKKIIIVDCINDFSKLFQVCSKGRSNLLVVSLIGSDASSRNRAYELGSYDCLTYPFIYREVVNRVSLISNALGYQCFQEMESPSSLLVSRAMIHLMNNIGSIHTLNSLACELSTNRNTLAKAFKEVTGRGVFSWLREQRMDKAKFLLHYSNLSIQQISIEVGYEETSNFSSLFKKTFGASPSTHRKLMVNTSLSSTSL